MNNLKKGFTWIIIAIILALIAGGGTYAAWRIQNSSKNEIQLPVSEVGTNTSDQQESDNWKTYRNEKYGLEFGYPIDWVIREEMMATQSPTIVVRSPEHENYLSNKPNAPYQGQYNDIVIVVHGYPWTDYNKDTAQSVIFNGMNALKFSYSGVYEAETYIVTNNQTRTFTVTGLLDMESGTIKSILSSLKLH
ncbi:MAG TPA: hypothetical protein VI981_05560 [Candidatus Paceibacterota bacterium]